MIGRVVSNKMNKTVSVLVESTKTHPLYGKSYASSKKYLVDDPFGLNVGDIVEFGGVAPISKNKHWRVTKVVGKDLVAEATKELKEEAKEAIAEVLPEAEEKAEEVTSNSQLAASSEELEAKPKKGVK